VDQLGETRNAKPATGLNDMEFFTFNPSADLPTKPIRSWVNEGESFGPTESMRFDEGEFLGEEFYNSEKADREKEKQQSTPNT